MDRKNYLSRRVTNGNNLQSKRQFAKQKAKDTRQ